MNDSLSLVHNRVRNILKHHNITELNGVLEADLIYGIIETTLKSIEFPVRKEYEPGKNFFQGENQIESNLEVDGWNSCLINIQKKFRDKLSIVIRI
jgi:hypothetical protein